MKILRNAFAEIAKDPAMQQDATKNDMEVQYVTSDETMKILKELMSQPPAVVQEFSKFIKF